MKKRERVLSQTSTYFVSLFIYKVSFQFGVQDNYLCYGIKIIARTFANFLK